MASNLADVKAHAFFGALEKYDDAYSKFINKSFSADDTNAVRLISMSQLLAENVKGSDDIFIPTQALQSCVQPLTQATGELNAYISNKNATHIDNAITHIGQCLVYFPSKFRPNKKSIYKNVLTEIEREMVDSRTKASEKVSALSEKIEELQEKAEELSSSIKSENERITDGLGNVEQLFTDSQGTRSAAFEKQIENSRKRLNEFLLEERALINTQRAELEKQLESIINDSTAKHKEILNLYGLTGKDAQIGGYLQGAKDANDAAKFWDRIAFMFMLLAITILIGPSLVSYARAGFTTFDWMQVLARLPISSIVLAPGGYALSQARRQKRISDEMTRNYLQLSALGPYLSFLPGDVQDKVRAMLTPRFFVSEKDETLSVKEMFSINTAVE